MSQNNENFCLLSLFFQLFALNHRCMVFRQFKKRSQFTQIYLLQYSRMSSAESFNLYSLHIIKIQISAFYFYNHLSLPLVHGLVSF